LACSKLLPLPNGIFREIAKEYIMNALALNISNIPVRQDQEGRYSLNDLHKASGNLAKHKPSEYLRNQQAKDLITEIELEAGIPAIKTIKGRGLTGTYAVKELVYAYAMWISPAFTLKVIHAYDSLVSVQYGLKQLPEPQTITNAQQGELFTIVSNKAHSAGKPHAYFWSRFQNHFKLSSYKLMPAEKFDEAKEYLRKLEGEDKDAFMMLTAKELSSIIRENMDRAKVGEVMPKESIGGVILKFEGDEPQKLLVSVGPLGTSITKLLPDEMVIKKGQFYIMEKKDGISAEKLVLDYIPAKFLPRLIEVAGHRLGCIESGKLEA
jgi:hypothetical protein